MWIDLLLAFSVAFFWYVFGYMAGRNQLGLETLAHSLQAAKDLEELGNEAAARFLTDQFDDWARENYFIPAPQVVKRAIPFTDKITDKKLIKMLDDESERLLSKLPPEKRALVEEQIRILEGK